MLRKKISIIINNLDNNGYIDIKYINIHESADIESRFHKQHPNSFHNTLTNHLGPFTSYQQNGNGQILSFIAFDNTTQFFTVFPQ